MYQHNIVFEVEIKKKCRKILPVELRHFWPQFWHSTRFSSYLLNLGLFWWILKVFHSFEEIFYWICVLLSFPKIKIGNNFGFGSYRTMLCFLYRRLVQMSSFFNTLLVLLFAVEECQGPRIHIFRTFTRFDTYLQTNVRRILTLGWHGYGSA